MAKITKKGLAAGAVDETIAILNNNAALTAKNAANSSTVAIIKVNASDKVEFPNVPQSAGTASAANDIPNFSQVGTIASTAAASAAAGKVSTSVVGQPLGVASLDASGKVPSSELPATTFPVTSVNSQTGAVVLTTTNVSEGTNLYYTTSRAKGDVVADSITISVHDVAPSQAAVYTALAGKVATSSVASPGGIASLDGSGKIPVTQLPNSVMELQGTWNAATNTPTLADGTGNTGDVYYVNVAGTHNLGSGAQTFRVGDYAIYDGAIWHQANAANGVTSVNTLTGAVTLTTDNVGEGTSNFYYTTARAKGDCVEDSIQSGHTSVAPSGHAVSVALATKQDAFSWAKEAKTLSSGDITNQYVDLAQVIKSNSLDVVFYGLVQTEGVDYSVLLTGGAGGKTRISFLGDIASSAAAADVLVCKYQY